MYTIQWEMGPCLRNVAKKAYPMLQYNKYHKRVRYSCNTPVKISCRSNEHATSCKLAKKTGFQCVWTTEDCRIHLLPSMQLQGCLVQIKLLQIVNRDGSNFVLFLNTIELPSSWTRASLWLSPLQVQAVALTARLYLLY